MILNGNIKNDIFHSKSLKKKQSSMISTKKTLFTENIRENNINIINFIKQKNKFKVQDLFDEKNSKKFLDSKNEAMNEIFLNDELDIDNNIKKDKKEKNRKSKYDSSTKVLKSQYLNEKTSDTDNKIEYNKTNKLDNSSNDGDFIYKFILENANESEEIFRKKLKKEMKRRDSKNKNSEKNFSKFSESKYDKKKKKISGKRQSLFKGQNPFKFSEIAKTHMINQQIEASSIKSSDYNVSQKIIPSKLSDEEEKDEINISNKDIENKNNNNSNNDFEIDSDKENFLNILSGLGQ
jgi:hypothetical protein